MKHVGSRNKNVAHYVVSALLQPATTFASASVVGALAITSLWPLSEALAQQQCTPTADGQTCVNSLTLSGGAIGINDTSTLTLTNNTSTGTISGTMRGINAANAVVQGNDGKIEATGAAGRAIGTSGDADVTNGSGTIQANGTNGAAIGAVGTATVINGSGTIQANGQGGTAIIANIVNVLGNSGTIQATGLNPADLDGIAIQALNSSSAPSTVHNIVHNLAQGTITGGNIGILGAASSIFFDVTNDTGATISGGSKGISLQGLNVNTVTNAGTISGTVASVEFLGAGTNVLTLQTGSKLNGTAFGSTASSDNQLILQGKGVADNDFQNFNSLTVQGGETSWALNGKSAVGTATLSFFASLVVGSAGHQDALLTGNIIVNSGTSLSGVGTIGGDVNVVNGGKLSPGDSAGTLKVSGNVGFAPGSTFLVTVDPNVTSNLAVGGTATLGSAAVSVQAFGTTFAPSTKYTILTAAGGGLGGTNTFDNNVTINSVFLKPSLTYDANDVFLTLDLISAGGGGGGGGTTSPSSVFATAAQTRNQIAVAGALDAGVLGAAIPITNPLLLALLNLPSAADARQAFDALSGEVFGSVQSAQTGQMHFTREAMLGRMRQASYSSDAPNGLGALSFGGPELAYASGDAGANAMAAVPGKAPAAARGPSRDLTFWAQGLGGWGHADSDGNAAAVRSRFGGFLSGADARFGETWRAGLVAGYMRTDLNVDDRSSSAGIDSVQIRRLCRREGRRLQCAGRGVLLI